MEKKIIELEKIIEGLKKKIKKLEEENKKLKIKNQRGAGRPPKLTPDEHAAIRMYRMQGTTLQELADMFKCSVSLIHIICKEEENKDE